ncbi:MAG: hypothetical protein ABJF01_24995 [bacterium]
MRTFRALTLAAAVVAALPSVSAAQGGRPFSDAWFWGVKVGGFTLADSGSKYVQAPTVGLEWLITRSKGGLYISGSETFFSQHAFTLRDPTAPVDSGFRTIKLKNMRKLDVALMGFPGDHIRFHPYFGLGFSMSQVSSAEAEGPFSSVDQVNFADQVIQRQKVAFSPLFIGGGQYRMRRFSVFGQLTLSPTEKNFLLYNGRPWNFGYEAGIRYNFGSSIDRN